jgi:hypothetical protein
MSYFSNHKPTEHKAQSRTLAADNVYESEELNKFLRNDSVSTKLGK